VPLAVTENIAAWPTVTDWPSGGLEMFGADGGVGFPEFEPEEPHPVKDTPRPNRMRAERYILVRILRAGYLFDVLRKILIQIRDIHKLSEDANCYHSDRDMMTTSGLAHRRHTLRSRKPKTPRAPRQESYKLICGDCPILYSFWHSAQCKSVRCYLPQFGVSS
jgi:hypothetical protein